jgi:hypothetical protein
MIAATAKPLPVWTFAIGRDGQTYTFQVSG